jgi:hypothetical protein
MELIEIIFTILILSGGFLFVVILVSYFISRRKRNDIVLSENTVYSKPVYSRYVQQQFEQSAINREINNHQPIIFHFDNIKNRSTKIVRKQTFPDREIQESLRSKNTDPNSKNPSNGKRYKIVNEELNKDRKPFVVNFYQ